MWSTSGSSKTRDRYRSSTDSSMLGWFCRCCSTEPSSFSRNAAAIWTANLRRNSSSSAIFSIGQRAVNKGSRRITCNFYLTSELKILSWSSKNDEVMEASWKVQSLSHNLSSNTGKGRTICTESCLFNFLRAIPKYFDPQTFFPRNRFAWAWCSSFFLGEIHRVHPSPASPNFHLGDCSMRRDTSIERSAFLFFGFVASHETIDSFRMAEFGFFSEGSVTYDCDQTVRLA